MIVDAEYEYFGTSQISFPLYVPDHNHHLHQPFIPALPMENQNPASFFLNASIDSGYAAEDKSSSALKLIDT